MPDTPDTDRKEQIVDEVSLPIVEERVRVDKVLRDGHTVTVRTRVREEQVALTEDLRKETVEVRRVPMDKVVDEVAPPREKKDVTIIPVYEERLVVTRQLVLVEEVHLVRSASTERKSMDVSRAFTEVEVSDDD